MTYPKSHLTRPVRLGIMIILIMLFFVISPLIILYTAGYRYDVNTREIQQTGVISIDVRPRDVEVRVNDIVVEKSIPIRLANTPPGTYPLEILAEGYHPWRKSITVRSKQTSYVRNITLFRESLPVQMLNDPAEHINDIVFSADGTHALLAEAKSGAYTISLYDTAAQSSQPITTIDDGSILTLEWSPFYTDAIVTYQNGDEYNILYIDPEQDAPASDLYTVTSSEPISTQWFEHKQQHSVFVQAADRILELTHERERDLQIKDRAQVWYIDADRRYWQYDTEAKTLSTSETGISIAAPITDIVHINEERVILGSADRTYVIDARTPQETLSIDGAHALYSRGTEEWLIWSPWELWTVYKDGNHELLNRTSEAVTAVAPLDSFGVLLLGTEDRLTGFNPGYYVTHELFGNGSIKTVGVDEESRTLYFHGSVGTKNGLFGLEY